MSLASLSRWIRRDSGPVDGRLAKIVSDGAGRDVLLLHGLAASPACWGDLRAELGKGYTVHRPHMKGFAGLAPPAGRSHGGYLKSMADELAAYLRKHGRGPVAVVGHSMGGIVSLILARDHADVVDRLMVVDVPSFFSVLINPFATEATFAAFAEATRRQYLDKSPGELEADLKRTARRLVRSEADLERVVEWGLSSDQALTADVMAEVMTTDLRPDLGSIAAPTDVIYAHDGSMPVSGMAIDQLYASAYAALPDARLVRMDETRHYIMLDQPERFHREVRTWLSR